MSTLNPPRQTQRSALDNVHRSTNSSSKLGSTVRMLSLCAERPRRQFPSGAALWPGWSGEACLWGLSPGAKEGGRMLGVGEVESIGQQPEARF